mmetsp:Transcript_26130/g.60075  ORF Transcript_26130/g.60075 Transcript_26130/m.60075 type:complete len:404 (-) Transcript_26130:394-1605(-)
MEKCSIIPRIEMGRKLLVAFAVLILMPGTKGGIIRVATGIGCKHRFNNFAGVENGADEKEFSVADRKLTPIQPRETNSVFTKESVSTTAPLISKKTTGNQAIEPSMCEKGWDQTAKGYYECHDCTGMDGSGIFSAAIYPAEPAAFGLFFQPNVAYPSRLQLVPAELDPEMCPPDSDDSIGRFSSWSHYLAEHVTRAKFSKDFFSDMLGSFGVSHKRQTKKFDRKKRADQVIQMGATRKATFPQLSVPIDGSDVTLLVKRGGCFFEDKARFIKNVFPSVRHVLVYDNSSIAFPRPLITMGAADRHNIHVSLMFISASSGQDLISLIRRGGKKIYNEGGIPIVLQSSGRRPIAYLLLDVNKYFLFFSCLCLRCFDGNCRLNRGHEAYPQVSSLHKYYDIIYHITT